VGKCRVHFHRVTKKGESKEPMSQGEWIRAGATAIIAEHATASTPESGVARRLTKNLVCQVLQSVGDFVCEFGMAFGLLAIIFSFYVTKQFIPSP